MNISRGIIGGAVKEVIYGPEGIGKTTFAAKHPAPIFIDTEGSTRHMDVNRVEGVNTWEELKRTVAYFLQHPTELGTLVIDTMDWAEKMAAEYICDKNGWNSIEAPGYGKGYVYLKEEISELLKQLTDLCGKGVNIVLVAHAILRKFELPDEMGSFDRWALKLNEKNVSPIVKEWADMVLFVNYKTNVIKTSTGAMKANGGQRVMYAQHNPCWDAKNRFGLPEEMPFDYEKIARIPKAYDSNANAKGSELETNGASIKGLGAKKKKKSEELPIPQAGIPDSMVSEDPDKTKLLEKVWENMTAAGLAKVEYLTSVVAAKGYYPATALPRDYEADFIEGCLIEAWDAVKDAMLTVQKSMNEDLPF